MSMTTPRVTVPVEPTEAMLEAAENVGMTMAGSDMSSPDMTRQIWSAMLSAAPAPEGGAVPASLVRRLLAAWPDDHVMGAPLAVDIAAALATRVEATAEAGEIWNLTRYSPVSSGNNRAMMEEDEAGLYVLRKDALRAQPQAREDVQPVAWRYRTAPHRTWHLTERSTDAEYEISDGSEVQPLFTHPAPDALLEAVEAYLTAVDDLETPVMSPSLGLHRKEVARQALCKLREALAALQAEQGAK